MQLIMQQKEEELFVEVCRARLFALVGSFFPLGFRHTRVLTAPCSNHLRVGENPETETEQSISASVSGRLFGEFLCLHQ